jgi:glycosyltransferase involved in cell wall biosynthesis
MALKKYFNQNHEYDIILTKEFNASHLNKYDVIYSLNWVLHKHIEKILPPIGSRKFKLVTTVCSHGGRNKPQELAKVFKHYDKISASSMLLYKELNSVYPGKIVYTPFGVDTNVFKKTTDLAKYRRHFGFVGKTNRDLKRYANIRGAIAKNKRILRTVSHTSNLNQAQMSQFYNGISTLICFSTSEGTPNPVLEAAACGRAVISTPVGNVPELFGKDYPLPPVTNQRELERQIRMLTRNRDLLKNCGDCMYNRIQREWSWAKRVQNFGELL